MKKYYLIYKITNTVNGKYYIGAHKTSNKDDGYMGSGKAIRQAEQKYGIENFEKDILFECSSEEEMFQKEQELVTEEVVNDRMSYNLKPGGLANFYFINHNGLNHKNNQHKIAAQKIKSDSEYAKAFSEKVKVGCRKGRAKLKKSMSNRKWIHNPITHENKFVRKDICNKLLLDGWKFGFDTTNSNNFGKGPCGRMWIRNPKTFESRSIKKTEPIPHGWEKGRFQIKAS